MSELLRVAAALRSMTDEKLNRLITERMVNSNQLVDFFDLAEALTKLPSVVAAIAALPSRQARELTALVSGEPATPEVAILLADQMLVSGAPAFQPFESTHSAFTEFKNIKSPSLNTVALVTLSDFAVPEQNQIDRDSGVEIFETHQAITELIFDLEQRFVREVGKRNVGLPDLKRLAGHLQKSTDFAKQIYELAQQANLITLADGRWQLRDEAGSWLAWLPTERFAHLAQIWQNTLGDCSAAELLTSLRMHPQIKSLDQQLRLTYPFADGSVNSKITKLAKMAALIGLSSGGWLSSWAPLILEKQYEKASHLAAAMLPQPMRKLIIQADLSLIAPGPLPTQDEISLRRFANTEQIGLASTYRLSSLSISHGLESGLTISDIRNLLLELSSKNLPQPVEYLLNESSSRFGRLVVRRGETSGDISAERVIISSSDPVLIAEILNDAKLKPFSLTKLADGSITTRFEAEVIYFALRELNFVAIQTDSEGKVISPLALHGEKNAQELQSSITSDIERLRAQEDKLGTYPDDDDLHRQIQLAIKSKSSATFTVTSSAGSEIQMLLEPIGIANGRLRAKDRKADIERTLPVSSIIQVTFI